MSCSACETTVQCSCCSSKPKITPRAGEVRIALVGNPNCGKTTTFNKYTGAHQHVGNYPGITVESAEGQCEIDGQAVRLIDLPGTYSMTAYSIEEIVVRKVLSSPDRKKRPQACICVADASSLERALNLVIQVRELGMPVVLACNMMDEAQKAGIRIDMKRLANDLGVPVFPMIARTGWGMEEILRAAVLLAGESPKPIDVDYGTDLQPAIDRIVKIVQEKKLLEDNYPARYLALKAIEGDSSVMSEVKAVDHRAAKEITEIADEISRHLSQVHQMTAEAEIADRRFGFARGVLRNGVLTRDRDGDRLRMTDRIDAVLTHKLVGPLLMLALMYGMFWATFELGAYPQGWVEDFFAALNEWASGVIPEGYVQSVVCSGIIDGVGGVLSFVPLIAIMFLFIAFLEDCGYMARMAYMLDRVFRYFGLHGASVMPYIVAGGLAGGCAIPGAMATRTLRSPKEKLATLLTLPNFACGAKLPVFLMLAGVFFKGNEANVMMGMSLFGWCCALSVAKLLRSTVIRGEPTPFVMELPPYRLPTLLAVILKCWERSWMYIRKAGTVILALSIIVWASLNFPVLPEAIEAQYQSQIAAATEKLEAIPAGEAHNEAREQAQAEVDDLVNAQAEAALRHSVAGRMGTAVEAVTLPTLGFDWRTDIALISGVAAKEAIVSTLGTAYSLGEVDAEEADPIAERLAKEKSWNPAVALALMVFVLLYSPCLVALAVIRTEAGSVKWLIFSILFNTAFAAVMAFIAKQIGTMLWL